MSIDLSTVKMWMEKSDIVEVVRCSECKYWRKDSDHTCRLWGGASPREANGFCSKGEREATE